MNTHLRYLGYITAGLNWLKLFVKKRTLFSIFSLILVITVLPGLYFLLSGPEQAAHPWPLLEDQRLSAEALNRKYEKRIDLEIEEFQLLMEEALILRARTFIFAAEIETTKANNQPISSSQHETMNIGIQQHLDLRHEFMKTVDRFGNWIDPAYDPRLSKDLRLKGIMLGMAAALTLYDNYALSILLFERNPELRKLANQSDSGYRLSKNQLLKMSAEYISPTNRERFRQVKKHLESHQPDIDRLSADHDGIAYVATAIKQSPSFHHMESEGAITQIGQLLGFFTRHSTDTIKSVSAVSLNELSKGFGNTVGLVQTRNGKLHKRKDVRKMLSKTLKPLDILLEKTPFRLTDKLIPGYYGHVAIWLGSKEELQAMNLWNDPIVKPFHNDILAGRTVLEALRPGVTISSLDHFLNVDDLAVLRVRSPKEDAEATVLRGFRQIGKPYDFNFDVETRDSIVCSELIYITFTDIIWDTVEQLGRATISPDNVARAAFDNGPLELKLLYRNGSIITKNPRATFRSLF